MHVSRMEALAAYLEVMPKHRFDLRGWFHWGKRKTAQNGSPRTYAECGTAACIGGYAALLADPSSVLGQTSFAPMNVHRVFTTAQDWLDLSYGEATYLFNGRWWKHGADPTKPSPTPQQAAAAIRAMVRKHRRATAERL